MRAIGFHGTSAEAAQRILASGFETSRNEYDWLGDGAYFFQDAPVRAMEWARQRFGDDAAVIGAEIDLDDCIDFLDVRWQGEMAQAYQRYRAVLEREGQNLPRQTRGAHRLDRNVVNYLSTVLAGRGHNVTTVRAAFGEGEPIFPGSVLLDRSHVQIAVRESGAILRTWRMSERRSVCLIQRSLARSGENTLTTLRQKSSSPT
jgi:hypothetical protein